MKINLRKSAPICGLAVLALVAGIAASPERTTVRAEKISASVSRLMAADAAIIPVLVVLKDQADPMALPAPVEGEPREVRIRAVYDLLRNKALSTQGDLIAFLQNAGVKYRPFYIYNMIAVTNATPELLQQLSLRADVAKIYGNPSVTMNMPSSNDFEFNTFEDVVGPGDNIVFTGATQVWEKLKVTGKGIVVAGQDTGVQWDHPALKNSYRGVEKNNKVDHSYSWHDAITETITNEKNTCGYNLSAPCDDNEHGTHTVGTMVGDDRAGNQVGMAPSAEWIACRNMDGGTGTPATYLDCFEWFLAPYKKGGNPMTDGDPSKAPHIINNSWGCPKSEGCTGDETLPALKAMWAAGVMVVVSAGNEGPGCATINDPPAYHTDFSLSVGAYDHRRKTIATFSSRGPSTFDGGIGPDVVAPGVDIRSTIPGSAYAGAYWSGTSMAGPHVAGQVALLWSAQPSLIGKIQETTEILRKSSKPTTSSTESCGGVPGTSIPNNTYGYGVIDVVKAMNMTLGPSGRPMRVRPNSPR